MTFIAKVYTYMVGGGGFLVGAACGYGLKIVVDWIRKPKAVKP